MLLELGPCAADDVLAWTKFARRIVLELRHAADQGTDVDGSAIDLGIDDTSNAMAAGWSTLLDTWSAVATAARDDGRPFRWADEMEVEVAEFLLHGLDRCLRSSKVARMVTADEAELRRPITTEVVRAFVDGLRQEDPSCRHYADQVSSSLADLLQD